MISLISLLIFLCPALSNNIHLPELYGTTDNNLASDEDLVIINKGQDLIASPLSDVTERSREEVLAISMELKYSWNNNLNITWKQSVESVKSVPLLLMHWCLSIMVQNDTGTPQGQCLLSEVNCYNSCAGYDCQISQLTNHHQIPTQTQNVDFPLGIDNNIQGTLKCA